MQTPLKFDITKETTAPKTYRVAKIMTDFDLQTTNIKEHFQGEITPPQDWQIGVIVGGSGTGKTTIARELFGVDKIKDAHEYTHPAVIDDMPENATPTHRLQNTRNRTKNLRREN